MLPLVSIIIPVYNGADFLNQAIESALSQTYQNIEIIVVNDGSDDNGETEKIALSYGNKIRYICKKNGGVSSALNLGIQNMNGEYFSWLSHDDTYDVRKIEKEISCAYDLGFDDALILCKCDQIDKDSQIITQPKTVFPHNRLDWKESVMYITKHGANGCAFLIPKKVFDKVGLFDENLRYCQDILMWWDITLAGYSIAFCDYVGVHSRVHGKQLTQTGSNLYHHDADYIGDIVIEKFADISDKKMNNLYIYAKEEAKHGNHRVLQNCIDVGKEKSLFRASHKIVLCLLRFYGNIRPLIRKIYYKLLRNIDVS